MACRSVLLVVVVVGLLSCAHERARGEDDGSKRPGSASIELDRRDRGTLSSVTSLLGGPLPAPAADDDVGIEKPDFEVTRAFAASPPRLAGRATRMRATAWKGRVHSVELTFAERCDAACARSLVATLEGWAGPMSTHQEGRVRFMSADADTVQVMLEVYPSKPDLTRVVLRCSPLWSASQGRPSRLLAFGEQPLLVETKPRCRPLPP